MNPFISVIVTSHERKSYLFEALDSIKNQTLQAVEYEVIVVTDFQDPDVNQRINELGFRTVYTSEMSFHGKIKVGAIESKGEILTFLEDDDKYAENRLEVIMGKFSRDEDLAYYHNSHIPIDFKGDVLEKSIYYNVDKTYEIKYGPHYEKFLDEISPYNPGFNTSSMAIRREIFMKSFKYFTSITGGVDNFIFFCSAKTGKKLIFDTALLTFYRIHLSNTIKKQSCDEFMSKRGDKEVIGLNNYRTIYEMTRGSPAEKICRVVYLEYKSYIAIFQAANLDKRFLPDGNETFFMLKNAFRTKRRFLLVLLVWTYLFRIAPRLLRYPYYKFKMWERNRLVAELE